MDKHLSKILILSGLVISLVGVVMTLDSHKQKSDIPLEIPPVVEAQTQQQIRVISPDGKIALNLQGNSLSLTNSKDNTQKEFPIKTASPSSELSVPANTFSPDDKYIFLKQLGSGQVDYFALRLADTAKVLDISGPFAAKYPDFVITDVTGWGGIGLIVVNTDKVGGGIGPSFWYDVYTQSFIRLSTRFN
jgi:hypothetical protein